MIGKRNGGCTTWRINQISSLPSHLVDITTGCSTISVPTLILNNLFISGPIIKPFNSRKVEMIRICLVYETPCQVQCLSIYGHHEFWQKNCLFRFLSCTVTCVNVTRVTLCSVTVFNMVRNPQSCHQKF